VRDFRTVSLMRSTHTNVLGTSRLKLGKLTASQTDRESVCRLRLGQHPHCGESFNAMAGVQMVHSYGLGSAMIGCSRRRAGMFLRR